MRRVLSLDLCLIRLAVDWLIGWSSMIVSGLLSTFGGKTGEIMVGKKNENKQEMIRLLSDILSDVITSKRYKMVRAIHFSTDLITLSKRYKNI